MGRRRNNAARLPPFVAVPWEVLNSAAFLALKHSARAALPYFLGKPKVPFNRSDYYDNDFVFSYPEAKRYGFATATFSAVIQQLVGHGFIDPLDKGGLRGLGKSCSRFSLSKRWERFGQKDFAQIVWKEFQPKRAA